MEFHVQRYVSCPCDGKTPCCEITQCLRWYSDAGGTGGTGSSGLTGNTGVTGLPGATGGTGNLQGTLQPALTTLITPLEQADFQSCSIHVIVSQSQKFPLYCV